MSFDILFLLSNLPKIFGFIHDLVAAVEKFRGASPGAEKLDKAVTTFQTALPELGMQTEHVVSLINGAVQVLNAAGGVPTKVAEGVQTVEDVAQQFRDSLNQSSNAG